MTIQTYRPGFSILVFKAITRSDAGQPSRLQGDENADPWDITPHLGDGSEISVSKSVSSPMGSFVITVPDQPYKVPNGVGDTLYGLLEPMDEIEIRLARSLENYPEGLPLLMRGFIRTIRRSEVMPSDGKPQRTTVIQGNDYGFLFEITQLPPLPFLNYGLNLTMFTAWESFMLIGDQQKPRPVGEFFQMILGHMVNKQAEAMKARFAIALDDPQPVTGNVSIPSQDQITGPIWNTLISYADTPWNELFLDDPETTGDDPPRLRFRTAPYRTWIKGHQILEQGETIPQMGQVSDYETVEITIADVVRLDASRSEQDTANIYWVPSRAHWLYQANTDMQNAAAGSLPGYLLLDGDEYPNSDPDLYCYRLMERESKLLNMELESGPDGLKKEEYKAQLLDKLPGWTLGRRKGLAECNCDNVLLEEGSMVVKGNEKIRAGKYISLLRGSFGAEYYAQTVTHRFAPYRQYTTTVNFIRGTGFIERVRLDTSPWLQEGKQGVYDVPGNTS